MQNYFIKQYNKALPLIERAVKWTVAAAFEALKLAGLAFTVMHVIVAAFLIECVLAGVIVFAALYFTKRNW